MNHVKHKPALVILLALAPAAWAAAPLKEDLKIDRTNLKRVRTTFGTYGYEPDQSVVAEADGLRLRLPAGVADVKQTGLYSHFALAGDCEVTIAYELLAVEPPQKGYGSGVGMAFDAGDEVGWATVQRVTKPGEGDGYVVQTVLAQPKGKKKEEYRFLKTAATAGRIGLKRVKKDLVFLAAETPDGTPQEIAKLPFTERAVSAVRLFVDAGGSPTAVDVRLPEIAARAEEVAAGEPKIKRGVTSYRWLWFAAPAAGVGLAAGVWWLFRQRAPAPVNKV